MPYYNYKKVLSFRKPTIILKSNDKAINLLRKANLNKEVENLKKN